MREGINFDDFFAGIHPELPLLVGLAVQGIVIGLITALVALGMALIYRSNRIINFAQADLGFAPVVVTFLLMTASGVPWLLAVAIGLALALVLGAATERVVIRRFFRAPRLLVTVATIGLSQVLVGLALLTPLLWGRGVAELGDGTLGASQRIPAPFDYTVRVGLNFNANYLLALVVVPCCVALVVLFLQRSDSGVAIRASADGADRAALLGIPVFRLQTIVWMLAAGLGFVAVFLRSGILGLPILGSALAFPVLLRALVAFIIGGKTNVVGVTVAAVGLGILESTLSYYHDELLVQPALVVIVMAVMLLRRRAVADERAGGDAGAWKGAEEVRPVPAVLRRLRAYRLSRGLVVGVLVASALVLPHTLGVGDLFKATTLLVYALLGLSLVVLSGWGGRISLGQVAYFAVGSAVSAWMVLHWDVDLVVALLAAGAVGAVSAVLVGLPTLRLPGLYLAVVTFAFALATTTYLLNPQFFDWVPEERVPRTTLVADWDGASGDVATYYLVLVVLGLSMLALRNIRSSRFGRALVALRDNHGAAEAYAIDGARVQLTAYALSGGIAAVAGALFMHTENVFDGGAQAYSPMENLAVLTMVVVGGMTAAVGPILGALFLLGTRWFLPSDWQLIVAGLGVIAVLLVAPGGLASVAYNVRDRLLRFLARRRGLTVPGYSRAVADLDDVSLSGGVPAVQGRVGQDGPDGPVGMGGVDSAGRSGNGDAGELVGAGVQSAAGPAPLLDVRGLDVGYGDVQVLFGVDLQVRPGESVALLGTNGAGKSTLLRAVSGLAVPSAGAVHFDDRALVGRPAHQVAAQGLLQMPGGQGVFPSLTVAENLQVAVWLDRKDRAAVHAGLSRVEELFPVLAERRGAVAGHLSGGQQQMLALAMVVVGRPKLLMIDELSLGLAPTVVAELLGLVDGLRAEGVSLLIVEQSVNVALGLADRAVFMERGQVRFSGPAGELSARPDLLRSVFLGDAAGSTPGDVAERAGGNAGRHTVARSDDPVAPAPGAEAAVATLAVRDLGVSFGGVRAVDEVSFDLYDREILGVIGPNGAGKTTLFDLLSGAVPTPHGSVRLGGRELTGLRASQRARAGLGRSFQDARLFPSLTVEETIAAALERWVPAGDAVTNALALPNAVDSEHAVRSRVAELIELLGLGEFRSLFVGELSTGTRRMVDLGCLLAHRPQVVLLDEPAAGIAQREVEALAPLIERVRDELGASVVLVEHDIPLVQRVADRLVAMDQGRVVDIGLPRQVLSHPDVVAAYLGEDRRALHRSGDGDSDSDYLEEESGRAGI